MNRLYLLLLVFSILIGEIPQIPAYYLKTGNQERGLCGDATWEVHSDTKCFKLLPSYLTWEEGRVACEGMTGSGNPVRLATVKRIEEQDHLTQFLFNSSGVVNNIWLGASRDSSDQDFLWLDGEGMEEYSNWAVNSPTPGTVGRDCVEMVSPWSKKDENIMALIETTTDAAGEWKDVNCEAGNWVVCEKFQEWSDLETQQAMLTLRKEAEKLRSDLLELRENPTVPLGFLYTEYPGQPSPDTIWPQHTWMDISGSFSGLFFRVTGSGAASFGEVQGDSTRLGAFSRIDGIEASEGDAPWSIGLPAEGWSGWILAGEDIWINEDHRLRFHSTMGGATGDEVRPRNMAIKIWRRTA